jgi:membrane protein DedA with SNARE-associated domain
MQLSDRIKGSGSRSSPGLIVSSRALTILIAILVLAGSAPAWGGGESMVESFLETFERLAEDSTSRLLLLLVIASATLISEDLACIAAGLLAAKAIISPLEAVVASGLGIYIGDILLYLSGYLIGAGALQRAPLRWVVSERAVEQCRRLFERRGTGLILVSRFIPGTRTATFIAAGLARMGLLKLLLVFGLAVLLWTPILVLSAMLIGRQVIPYVDMYSSWAVWVFLLLLGLLFLFTRLILPLFTWRGRRLLLSRWRRITRWEFWPFYITNIVTFFYVLYAGVLKYRRPTLFTVANPAIRPDSGFIGESKTAILRGLPRQAVGCWQPVRSAVSADERVELLSDFMQKHQLDYPIVMKPDRGQRGQGVGICRDEAEARDWLAEADSDYLMMEFQPGEEFGLFYYRYPESARGEIFAINRKKLLFVTGDGSSTLEELILKDERAVCLAPTFFRALEPELLDIVPHGESKQLVRVGTHSRGALFLEGGDLITPELLEAVEDIVASYEGFYFGRFDFKAPSEHDFKQGKNLRVIELNGVTSEATNMYDPKHSIFEAWKILIEQWSIAFAIAEQNLRRGHRPMALAAFIKHWIRGGRST